MAEGGAPGAGGGGGGTRAPAAAGQGHWGRGASRRGLVPPQGLRASACAHVRTDLPVSIGRSQTMCKGV